MAIPSRRPSAPLGSPWWAQALALSLVAVLAATSPSPALAQGPQSFSLPLYYGMRFGANKPHAQWFLPATVGRTPANLTFDTGSSIVYMAPLTGYQPGPNGTCSTTPTTVHYHSGNVTGVQCTDTVTVGPAAMPNHPVLDVRQQGSSNQALSKDGNTGWACPSNETSVPETLAAQGLIPSPVFSTWAPMDPQVPGELVVGGQDPSRHANDMVYVPIIPNTYSAAGWLRTDVEPHAFYFWQFTVRVEAVYRDGSSALLCANCTAIADSGTSAIDGPTAAIQTIQAGYGPSVSKCLTALRFTFANGATKSLPTNDAAGCKPIIPCGLFNDSISSSVSDPNSWFTLGAPFTSAFYMTWDMGATDAGRQLGLATPTQATWPGPLTNQPDLQKCTQLGGASASPSTVGAGAGAPTKRHGEARHRRALAL